MSFKRSISASYCPLGPLVVSPIVFLSQTFWGFISLVQVQRVGMLDVGHKPLPPLRKTLDLWDPSLFGVSASGVGFLERLGLCLSYSSPCGLFIHCCGGAFQLVSSSFSEGTVPYVAVDLMWRGGSKFSFFLHHLGPIFPTMPLTLLFSLLEMPFCGENVLIFHASISLSARYFPCFLHIELPTSPLC